MKTKNLSHPLYVTAVPLDGKTMLGGVFKMHDQVGFPIDCCVDECRQRGYSIDWLEAMCDCWLNGCCKFESFVRQVESQLPGLSLQQRFSQAGAAVLEQFPEMRRAENPVDEFCKYVLRKKRENSWETTEKVGALFSATV